MSTTRKTIEGLLKREINPEALERFVNDTTHHPTDLSTWIETYREVFTSMGIKPDSPLMSRIIILFPPV